ncbi:MAG: ExbD/TolR family protein [Pirellulales bacterium]
MPLKTQLDEAPTINLTPMIDVVFLLIIFFMVATRFTEIEKNIQLHLPQVPGATAMTSPPRNRVVQVYQDGSLTIDRQPITIDALASQLTEARREYPQLGVVIRGDAGVRYQHVAEVLAACNRAGIAELGVSVRIGTAQHGTQVR